MSDCTVGMNRCQQPNPDVKRRRQRAVADSVTDEMLTTPTGELTDAQVAVLRAVLAGPFADEITARIDALAHSAFQD